MNGTRFTYGTAQRDAFTLCGCSSNAVRGISNDSSTSCPNRWSTSNMNARNDAAIHHQPRFGNTTMNKNNKEK